MKSNILFALATVCVLAGCGGDKKLGDDSASPAKSATATKSADPKGGASSAPSAASPSEKPDFDKIADAVTFAQASDKDGTFSGKLTNTSTHTIGSLEYDAFAYGKDGKLLERIQGKYPTELAAGKGADIQVGPFKSAAGKDGVTVEVVVAWMNVEGTSFQRPVPKDRAKGGPNNMLKK